MSDQSPAPAPAWEPPTSDQEFKFETIDSAPSWVDKGWASWSRGPALAVPAGRIGSQPYTTNTARKGDTVKFSKKTGLFTVVPGEPPEEAAEPPKRVGQASAAPLEDQLRSGAISEADLDDDAKVQVMEAAPDLRAQLEKSMK
jgi:hypothetical protein